MARTDLSMLRALTDPDHVSELQDSEREAFNDMLGRIESGRAVRLTEKQRTWVEGVYLKLHLDAKEPSENLFSSGKVKKPEGPVKVFPFETMARPLKPPGRS